MSFFYDLETSVVYNTAYRRVIYTDSHIQLVYMSLDPKVEIGTETHANTTQFIRVEEGKGIAVVAGEVKILYPGAAVIVPAGTQHNIINISSKKLKLYTIYSPPEHRPGLVEKRKN